LILIEHRLNTKNGPKIKIDWYFFVEIEGKKIKLKLQGECELKKNKKFE
jgi:hypothetical protein